jgi:Domain of unknown function (DUF4115)
VNRRAETVVLLGAGALIVMLVAVNVMAAQGYFSDDEPGTSPAATTATTDTDTRREPAGSEPGTTAADAQRTEAGATTIARRPPPLPRLVLTAARGDCYLSVRRESVSGEVLYDAILPVGGSIDFTGARIWLRIGASTNLDATLDGNPLALPPGTVDVVVTRTGVQLA